MKNIILAGSTIRSLMTRNGLTIRSLAARMGITQVRVRKVIKVGLDSAFTAVDWIEAITGLRIDAHGILTESYAHRWVLASVA